MSPLLNAGGWGHLGHLSQNLSSPSSAPMPTVVRMVSSSCLPLSLPSSHATQGFQEELPPWVAAQHPLSRRTPMPGHQPPEGQGHTQLVLALSRGSTKTHQEVSPGDRTHFSLEEGLPRGSWASAWTHPWVSSSQRVSW